jgi:isocitrate dehydrogenase kinase/phosphatase
MADRIHADHDTGAGFTIDQPAVPPTSVNPPPRECDADVTGASALVLNGFVAHRTRTSRISKRARQRFERRDWVGLHRDALEWLGESAAAVAGTLAQLEAELGPRFSDRDLWRAVRPAVEASLAARLDADLGSTFYNSIVRRALGTIGADPDTEFTTDIGGPANPQRIAVTYRIEHSVAATIRRLLGDLGWTAPWRNLPADAAAIAGRIESVWTDMADPPARIEVLPLVMYRGTRAFVVGRLAGGAKRLPLTIVLRHDESGVAADAVLLTEDAVSIVFSFTRAYFHADAGHPAAVVAFLREIMPRKPRSELYTALGFFKHGKTLLYRDVARQISESSDCFQHAPGARGMVMAAFVLPGIDVVFKVIRDEFAPPKTTTRRDVMERYALVFTHDRAGRLVDAQEFEHLAFPRDRFTPPLLEDLRSSCGSLLRETGETIEVRHLYTERRLVPLDLFLATADRSMAEDAILDWGQSVKDLAATNIFPGDLLLKNFGVTRHGRVVFYDYDELCPLDACRFRRLPPARDDDEEMSVEPWFHVGEHDIFPEEFPVFLGVPAALKPAFLSAHGDLFTPDFWRSMQARHAAGDVVDILPYRESQRLRHVS